MWRRYHLNLRWPPQVYLLDICDRTNSKPNLWPGGGGGIRLEALVNGTG